MLDTLKVSCNVKWRHNNYFVLENRQQMTQHYVNTLTESLRQVDSRRKFTLTDNRLEGKNKYLHMHIIQAF